MYGQVCDYNNLYQSYLKARKSKRWKGATVRFENQAMFYIQHLKESLENGTYKMGEYNVFKIYEPKERIIKSIPFIDKVVQRSLCDYALEPLLEKHFIYDNYASRRGKGVHAGINRTKEFLRRHYRMHGNEGYILKCDVEKYFDSINHEVLKSQLAKLIKDPKLLWLVNMIVDSTDGDGLPIGNQTSQLFSLLYLSGMDHFIKEKLKVKYYIRYMDDFVLIDRDKEYLQYCKREIVKYLDGLKLTLNKSSHIFPIKNGADFLGFHFYVTDSGKIIMKLRRASKERMRRKLKKYKVMYKNGEITKEQIDQSWASWLGHASHGNTYHLVKKMRRYYNQIFEEDKNETKRLTGRSNSRVSKV